MGEIMYKGKKMATIFWGSKDIYMENIHLMKDPGMIPLTLHKEYGFDADIVVWTGMDYPYKDIYFSGIGFQTIKCRKTRIIKWLVGNAKKYPVLHLHFFSRWTWIYIWIYKLFNKKGLVYVHCDTDGKSLLNGRWHPRSRLKFLMIKKLLLTDRNLKDILWGIQNRESCERLSGKWPFYNLRYIPDGVWWGRDDISVEYNDRDNVLLTVARNGTLQKRTDLLLEGFAAVANEFPSWKLKLVGTVEKDFESYIKDYFIRNPELKSRVAFLGAIADKKELQKTYSHAKVFCLTSAWESFGLVTVEALSCGCYVIESDIPANIEITQNGKYGGLFKSEDLNSFIEQLRINLSDEEHMKKVSEAAKEYVENNFTWKKVLEPVDGWICEKLGKNPWKEGE